MSATLAEGWLTPLSGDVLVARARFPREVLLARIADDVRALFPGRVERLAPYGSRARNDARDEGFAEDSDWDVAVFLHGWTSADGDRLADWADQVWLETGWFIDARALPNRAWEEPSMDREIVGQLATYEATRNHAIYGKTQLDNEPALKALAWAERFVAEVERVLS